MKKVKFLGLGFLSAILLMMFGILAFWIEAVEAKSVFAETSNKSASVALFSVEANDTCVYFDEQGVQPLFIQYGATGVQFPVPVSEEGKIFQGWYYNDRQYTDSEGNLIGEWDIQEEEITLKAKWEYEDEFYTIMTQYNNITYYYSIENGWNTNPANVVKRGDKLESSNSFETDFRKLEIIRNQSLTIFKRDGEEFNLTDPVIPDLGSNNEIVVLEPVFSYEKHILYFDSNGGIEPSGFQNSIEVISGTDISSTMQKLTEDQFGRSFAGWKIDQCLGDESLIGKKLDGIMPDCTKAQGNGSIRLLAEWNYRITYVLDGGSNHGENPSTYSYFDECTFKDPTKTFYDFGGWFFDQEFNKKCTEIKDCTGDLVLYAKWVPIVYTITCRDAYFQWTQTFALTAENSIVLPVRTRSHYNGVWSDGVNSFQFGSVFTIEQCQGNVTLNLIWSANLYNINYYNLKFGDQTASTPTIRTYRYGEALNLDNITTGFHVIYPHRDPHCEFLYWCSDPSLKTPKHVITPSESGTINLYARWRYVSPNSARGGQYTITDSGRFNQPYDQVSIGMTWETPGYDALNQAGFKYLVLQIELTAWEKNDGYQYIMVYDGPSDKANMVASQEFTISSSTAVVQKFTFVIDISKLRNTDILYIRYGASGNWSDTWYSNEFVATVQYVVEEEDIKIMENGSIMY